jgi:[calcium/calmodulin-dependent protein kinase] kinase
MVDPNAGLTAEGEVRDDQAHSSPASSVCPPTADAPEAPEAPEASGEEREGQQQHGASPPSQGQDDENDCTPRSEVPSVPEALNASLLSQIHTLDPEPSYFSPQPLRIYSSPIPR